MALETEIKTQSETSPDGAPETSEREFKTSSGFEINRVYGPEAAATQPSLPGEFPFVRGLYPEGYRKKLWTMRMYCGFGTAKETNKRFHYLINHGETGLSLAFDLPTQIGLDPDDPKSKGEVGKVGVSISGLWDFEKLFANIDLAKVSVSMTINSTAFILYALYVALAQKRGMDIRTLRGTVQNDILKEYLARGTYAYPPEPSLRVASDLIVHSVGNTPIFYPISISGYHIREAGATAVDEAAFTLANALVYLENIKKRGGSLEPVLPRISFFFGVHNHFLEEIAKFRAVRKVWAELLKDRFGINEPKLLHLRFHAQTCGSTLVQQEPMNNAVRVSLQAMAAVLGGAQSLHTNSYDEAISIPTEMAQLLALRTQQLLAVETGVVDTADPLGGAYAIEALTQGLAGKIKQRIEDIQARGGMLKAIAQGYAPQALADSSYRYQKEIEAGKTLVVGVNTLKERDAYSSKKAFRLSPKSEGESIRETRKHKKMRDAVRVRSALDRLANAAQSGGNIIPFTIESVFARATLGEIAGRLRDIFGTHQ
ncbi:MAG: methylmalonyl-CoA mutase [Elusimicrobia bacterium]|nr:methylmalonyl-CoA mutase [Elusimicrobiota bacterium]